MRLFRVVIAGLVVVACGGGEPTPPSGGGGGDGGGGGGGTTCVGATNAVSIGDNVFTPVCTRLGINATVTWTNSGSAQHNVTFDNSAVGNSPVLNSGSTFSKTFATAGTYDYRCTLHAGMNGSVQIQ